jgi:hypothetical protein
VAAAEEGWLLSADRLFYNWADWCAASDSGADLLWRVKDDLRLPYLELLPDGSYRSVLVKTAQPGSGRDALIEAARCGEDLDPALARHVRVVEYEADGPDGGGELIALLRQPRPRRAGDLALSPDRLGPERPDLRRGRRGLDRPRPGQLRQGRPNRPPGRRPGLSPSAG